jgi:hypothetical protein
LCLFEGDAGWDMPRKLVVTSVCDGRHKKGSLHYKGLAFDVRTWANGEGEQLGVDDKEIMAKDYREVLGPDFDVVVESTHIHIEYQPKR